METQLSMFVEKDGKWEKRLEINSFDKFHNTIDLPESELKVRQLKAGNQNNIVYHFFCDRSDQDFTPAEVYYTLLGDGYINHNTPLTSIRRAMTDLTKLGYLEKTKEKRAGEYGELNYCWRLLIKSDE